MYVAIAAAVIGAGASVYNASQQPSSDTTSQASVPWNYKYQKQGWDTANNIYQGYQPITGYTLPNGKTASEAEAIQYSKDNTPAWAKQFKGQMGNPYTPAGTPIYGDTVGGQLTYNQQQFAPFTSEQNQAMTGITDLATNGSPYTDQMRSYLSSLMGGSAPTAAAGQIKFPYQEQLTSMVNGQENPYLNQVVDAAIRPVSENYQNTVMPQLKSNAQLAGRTGSSAYDLLANQAATDYTRNVGDISSNLHSTLYEDAQNRALQAMNLGGQMATSQAGYDTQANLANAQNSLSASALGLQATSQQQQLNNADITNLQNLYNVGTAKQTYNQQSLDQNKLAADFAQMEPWTRLGLYQGATGSNGQGITTNTSPLYGGSATSAAAGGATTGMGLYNLLKGSGLFGTSTGSSGNSIAPMSESDLLNYITNSAASNGYGGY